jgi:hypothetical protein
MLIKSENSCQTVKRRERGTAQAHKKDKRQASSDLDVLANLLRTVTRNDINDKC